MDRHSFSFPPKVTALLIAIVVIGATVYLVNRFVYGTITIRASVNDQIVVTNLNNNDTLVAPATFRLKPGRYQMLLNSTEFSPTAYANRTVTVTVYPFHHSSTTVTMNKVIQIDAAHFSVAYQYDQNSFLIVPKASLDPTQPPTSELSKHWGQYASYAGEALGWIKSMGDDPKTMNITWWLEDQWPKGKSIPIN